MKSYMFVICLACAMLFPSLGHTSQPGDTYLRFLEGDVQVKTEDTTEWLPASINMPLLDGDHIWVPDNARAELMHRDGTIIRLDRNSYLEIISSEENRIQLYLAAGRAYGNTKLRKGDTVVIETPTVSFRAYGQSAFGIDVSENEDSVVSVFQGGLYADRSTGQMKINAGDKMVFYNTTEYPQLSRITPMDQWEQWNRRKDQEFVLSLSGRPAAYLPDELAAYSSDFERNGKWVYEQEYGYVWTPTAIVVKDWSPYKVGRWVWIRGDYVWISYEPWGWAPYHYGRWAFINNRGWCWVPPARGDVYWGPGFVGWVYTPTYISWVPLAPREIYYGHGNYGPHSINIRNVNINTTTIHVVYRNIHVKNAVMTLHHDTVVGGRSISRATKENLFLRQRRVMGAPDIKPERSALAPVMKQIPQINRPPQHIVNRVSNERSRNNRLDQTRKEGNLPLVPNVTMPMPGQTNDRKIEAPQSPKSTPARVEQVSPPVRYPNVITGPQESSRERAARRLGEIRRNSPSQNIVNETAPQPIGPIHSMSVPEKMIEAPERKIEAQGNNPGISVNEQPSRARIIAPQISKPAENVRSTPPLRSNGPAIAVQPQLKKNEDKPIVRDIKPQEAHEVRTPVRLNDIRSNIPPRNTIKETLPQQATPIRPAMVPERKIEVQEKKIEIQRKASEVPLKEVNIKAEARQQLNPDPMKNAKIAPPVRSDIQATISQQSPPPRKPEDPHIVQKTEQTTQIRPIENIISEKNRNDHKREARSEIDQRRK